MPTNTRHSPADVDWSYQTLKAAIDEYNKIQGSMFIADRPKKEEVLKNLDAVMELLPPRSWYQFSYSANLRNILTDASTSDTRHEVRAEIRILLDQLDKIKNPRPSRRAAAAAAAAAAVTDDRTDETLDGDTIGPLAPPAVTGISASRDSIPVLPTAPLRSSIDGLGTFTSTGRDLSRGRRPISRREEDDGIEMGAASETSDDEAFVLGVQRAPDPTPAARSISPATATPASAAAAAAAAATSVAATRDEPLPLPSSRPTSGASLASGGIPTDAERLRGVLASRPPLRESPARPLHLAGTGERTPTATIDPSQSRGFTESLSTLTGAGFLTAASMTYTTHRLQELNVERNEETQTLTIRSDSEQMKTPEGQTDHLLLAAQAIEIARREFSGDGGKPQIILSKGPAEVLYYIQQIAKALEAKGLMVLVATPDAHAKISNISPEDKEAFDRNIQASFGSTDPKTLARNFLRIYDPTSGRLDSAIDDTEGTDRTLIESFVKEHPLFPPPSMSRMGASASDDDTGPSTEWVQEFTKQISQVGLFHTVNVDQESQFYTQIDSTRTFGSRP